MDNLLNLIYKTFMKEMKDLELGHMLKDQDLCDIWNMIHAYEMLDSNMLNTKEQKLIIEHYG